MIEKVIEKFQTKGWGKLRKHFDKGLVRLCFDRTRVEAESEEIALVRLAAALIDDSRFRPAIMNALREPLQRGL